ncbi:MAG: hypothetical protein HKN85_01830 [Gammaproteobacteria bacterium]|nr:hypothetical protein [Gammaproteobacteria bacterium]
MKPDLKKALDREIRLERNRKLVKWLAVAAGVVFILAIYTPVFSERIYGQAIGLSGNDRSSTSKIQIKVKLESGKEVVLTADESLEKLAGRKVEISKMKSIFGMASYQFVQYVD